MKKRVLNIGFIVSIALQCSFSIVVNDWIKSDVNELSDATKKMSAFFDAHTKLSVDIHHFTFKGHNSNTPYQQASGYFKRDKNNFHSLLMGIHSYQNKNFQFTIDTLEKTILVENIKSLNPSKDLNVDPQLSQKYIDKCKKSANEIQPKYRVEFKSPYTFEATELEMNKNSSLASVTMFYRAETSTSKEHKEIKAKPKARIEYKNYNTNPTFNAGEFDNAKYFTVKGKNLMLTKKYSGYTLFDNRIKK